MSAVDRPTGFVKEEFNALRDFDFIEIKFAERYAEEKESHDSDDPTIPRLTDYYHATVSPDKVVFTIYGDLGEIEDEIEWEPRKWHPRGHRYTKAFVIKRKDTKPDDAVLIKFNDKLCGLSRLSVTRDHMHDDLMLTFSRTR